MMKEHKSVENNYGEYNDDEERYVITPKGIACLSLLQCGLVTDINDPRIEGFWALFENGMRTGGYVKEEEYDN